MKKRALCFLAAAVLLLLLPCASPADGCDHAIKPSEWILQGYVDPQPGVPGYSGDFCCPVCGAVKQRGQQIAPQEIVEPEPDAPASEPDPPADIPSGQEEEPPAEPDQPVTPPQPQEPEAPPADPPAPQPEASAPESAPESAPAAPQSDTSELPPVVPETRPEESAPAEQPANPPANKPNTGNQPRKKPAPTVRERFSAAYPYRRVKMTPAPGLRAEAAGIPLGPAGSPLQQLLGN